LSDSEVNGVMVGKGMKKNETFHLVVPLPNNKTEYHQIAHHVYLSPDQIHKELTFVDTREKLRLGKAELGENSDNYNTPGFQLRHSNLHSSPLRISMITHKG
jgi:hypothetical protein